MIAPCSFSQLCKEVNAHPPGTTYSRPEGPSYDLHNVPAQLRLVVDMKTLKVDSKKEKEGGCKHVVATFSIDTESRIESS